MQAPNGLHVILFQQVVEDMLVIWKRWEQQEVYKSHELSTVRVGALMPKHFKHTAAVLLLS